MSRTTRRRGTKTKVCGEAKAKPPKSRGSRVWKLDGKFQPTSEFRRRT